MPIVRIAAEELRSGLSRILDSSLVRIRRRPHAYQSSFALEEIAVVLADGTDLNLVFKDLGIERMVSKARSLRPAFVYCPLREIRTYSHILTFLNLGTPRFYGAVTDEKEQRYWLFLENVPGIALYQIGDFSVWRAAARWLALLHERCAATARSLHQTVPLLSYTEDYGKLWLRRAETAFARTDADKRDTLGEISRPYQEAVRRIAGMPVTLLHGEFYPSNILVDSSSGGLRICPVDWEMAAVGPAALDLAALTSGQWNTEERTSLARAYVSARRQLGGSLDLEEFLHDVEYCRLFIAIQWLGWFGKRTPYRPHRQDWLSEAVRAAAQTG